MEVDENSSGIFTNEEKAVILKLRENIKHELPIYVTSLSIEDQDLFLVRWLRARDLDLDKSEKMLRSSLQWRIERKADQALHFEINPFYTDNYPFAFKGTDKFGHPVFVAPMSDWDMRKVINNPDRLAEFDDFATYFFETITSHIKNEHDKRKGNGQGPVTQFMLLVDVENYSYMQLINFKAISKILHLASMYEAHYPEILYRCIFISCPRFFSLFITMLKPIIAPKTMGKISCYPQISEWRKELKELMDPSQIPERDTDVSFVFQSLKAYVEQSGINVEDISKLYTF